jgi:hypothetical protein
MLEPDGHVRFLQWGPIANRVPLVRWTTAPTFRALAGVLLARRSPVQAQVAGARLD